jgi:hypothetical protein
MRRLKTILGMTAAALMIASSGAHSLFGWAELRGELEQTKAPGDLILALSLGWQFAGTAMLVFGCIVMELYFLRLRGKPASLWPAAFIGVAYVAFGACALLMSRFDPFFLVFVVPGVLLLVAAALRD